MTFISGIMVSNEIESSMATIIAVITTTISLGHCGQTYLNILLMDVITIPNSRKLNSNNSKCVKIGQEQRAVDLISAFCYLFNILRETTWK
jgi:hypothetical protein